MRYDNRKWEFDLTEMPLSLPKWIACFLVCCLFTLHTGSCMRNAGVEYSSFIDISGDGIPENRAYVFFPVPADSLSSGIVDYDVILVVRYNSSAKAGSIILDVEELSLRDENPDTIRVSIPLFDDNDEPVGKGNYSIYEAADTLRHGIRIQDGYLLSVSTPLPREETIGIRSIGIILSRSGSGGDFNLFKL